MPWVKTQGSEDAAWAARYNTWLVIKDAKRSSLCFFVISFLFFSLSEKILRPYLISCCKGSQLAYHTAAQLMQQALQFHTYT